MIRPEIIDGLIRSDDKVIESLYREYRSGFIAMGASYSLGEGESLEIFHDSLLILRSHAINGNLAKVRHELKTYLFAIGKYRIFDILKRQKQSPVQFTETVPEFSDADLDVPDADLSDKHVEIMTQFEKLGESCRKMLTFFYFEGLTIDEIVLIGKYENSNVVRSQKSRCLRKLKEMIHGA